MGLNVPFVGRLASLWMVMPPTANAAFPVGAPMATWHLEGYFRVQPGQISSAVSIMALIVTDLPVPAVPMMCMIIWSALKEQHIGTRALRLVNKL